ncbi:MAG: transcription termination/antitermination factor NusG [Selenomonadaceae bacterium]|nr:transcription termination/antitermination factor NusG [Selenomonadaceae bacterium]MBR1859805.1 transcription termination/antitermination factor NusG [Selenomonadaceae bacterium]
MEQKGSKAWYVIHTYSGYENKVKVNLEKKVASQGLGDVIFEVVVPMHTETEVKDGKKRIVQRKIFPGYVLVHMIVNNYSWYVVRNTQGVTGFVGSEKEPIPLTFEEADRILNISKKTLDQLSIKIKARDRVRIISGLFEDYTATVKEVDMERHRLKVLVEGTPIDLDLEQVEKI